MKNVSKVVFRSLFPWMPPHVERDNSKLRSNRRADYLTAYTRTRVPQAEAYAQVKPKNRAILDAGHELTIKPGTVIRRMMDSTGDNARPRYYIIRLAA